MDKKQKYSEAMDIFNEWNDVVGIFQRNTSYYYEIEGVIEEIVKNCFKAEIDMPISLDKWINMKLLEELKNADKLIFEGICKANTAQHKTPTNRLENALEDLDSGYKLLESVIKELEKLPEDKKE